MAAAPPQFQVPAMDPTFYPAYSYNPQAYQYQPYLYYAALPQGLQIQQQPQENELSQEATQPVVYPVLIPPTQTVPEPQPEEPQQQQASTCCVDEEQGGECIEQQPPAPLDNLQQELLLKQELMIRRRLAFYILIGLMVFFLFCLFGIPWGLTLSVSLFYLFGTLAIQLRSRGCLLIFAIAHFFAFYVLGRVVYSTVAHAVPVTWLFLLALSLITFSVLGSFIGSLRYACFLRKCAN